ncbi:MAG: signal peptidase I [Clostridiales bacterium]
MLRKKLSPVLAAILSIIAPGLGQIYNGQLKKGLYLFTTTYFLYIVLVAVFKILSTFTGAVLFAFISMSWVLFLATYAVTISIKRKEKEIKPFNKWYFYIGFLLINTLVSFACTRIVKHNYFRSFGTPTSGMEPAIHTGDYFVADMSDSRFYVKPGDIIIFKSALNPDILYTKRCIAVGGQRIMFDELNIWVDGQKVKSGIQNSVVYSDSYNQELHTRSYLIPKDTYFVLGDNYFNSLDSRHYGVVHAAQIMGKPLYIYWSGAKSRVGMNIK